MCRFLVYKGTSPILLSDLILSPAHSILNQSYDSRLRLDHRRPHNADGFGVGHYTLPPITSSQEASCSSTAPTNISALSRAHEPCVFKSTLPAWNCINLERLASKTTSSLIFAHVRATTEGNLSDQNCHPFWFGALMWMHNGGIGAWRLLKRKLASELADEWFNFVQGGTDSEWAFALFLDCLQRRGVDPSSRPPRDGGFGHTVLREAMLEVIAKINELIAAIPEDVRTKEDTRSLLNFAVTDGYSVVCTRYVNSKTDLPASLFWSSGTCWREVGQVDGKANFKMERKDKGADIVLVASEPLTFEREAWVTVPINSVLTIHKQAVLIHPIRDEFYTDDPSCERSSAFAHEKGQSVTQGTRAPVVPAQEKLSEAAITTAIDLNMARSRVATRRP